MRFGSSEEEKSKPVKKHFNLVFQSGGKTIGFNTSGAPYHITNPIIKQFKGMVHTYLCTKDGSIYSTDNLQTFD
jgi:hypothetical protein